MIHTSNGIDHATAAPNADFQSTFRGLSANASKPIGKSTTPSGRASIASEASAPNVSGFRYEAASSAKHASEINKNGSSPPTEISSITRSIRNAHAANVAIHVHAVYRRTI